MKRAIAGVVPAETNEVAVMTIWPSISVFATGRLLGRLYGIRWPSIHILQLGNLLALLSIPLALPLYFCRILPGIGRRYTLTNRRVVTQTAITGIELDAVPLDSFDSIEVDALPGQTWFDAGDLKFSHDGREVFRLGGVSRPEVFRQTCLKSHRAYVGVKHALQQQSQTKSA